MRSTPRQAGDLLWYAASTPTQAEALLSVHEDGKVQADSKASWNRAAGNSLLSSPEAQAYGLGRLEEARVEAAVVAESTTLPWHGPAAGGESFYQALVPCKLPPPATAQARRERAEKEAAVLLENALATTGRLGAALAESRLEAALVESRLEAGVDVSRWREECTKLREELEAERVASDAKRQHVEDAGQAVVTAGRAAEEAAMAAERADKALHREVQHASVSVHEALKSAEERFGQREATLIAWRDATGRETHVAHCDAAPCAEPLGQEVERQCELSNTTSIEKVVNDARAKFAAERETAAEESFRQREVALIASHEAASRRARAALCNAVSLAECLGQEVERQCARNDVARAAFAAEREALVNTHDAHMRVYTTRMAKAETERQAAVQEAGALNVQLREAERALAAYKVVMERSTGDKVAALKVRLADETAKVAALELAADDATRQHRMTMEAARGSAAAEARVAREAASEQTRQVRAQAAAKLAVSQRQLGYGREEAESLRSELAQLENRLVGAIRLDYLRRGWELSPHYLRPS